MKETFEKKELDKKLICKICGKKYENYKKLAYHILRYHKMNIKNYYDLYLKSKNEEICNNENCNNICNFANINYGYFKYCSRSCKNKSAKYRKVSSLSSKSMWEDLNSSYHSKDRSNKLRKKFIEMWKDPNSIFRGEEYKNKKSESIKKLHKDPNSGYNTPSYRNFRSNYMKNGGSAHCHKFIKNPSKPQVELFNLCQGILPYPILNYPCLRYSIDIAIPSLNLAIEYDGSYWHQDKKYDENRQYLIENEGWVFLKYVDYVPDKQELLVNINEVLKHV